ncbi:MAG: monovalent cation/H(+) antiporter subunit G [Dehalococcoidia bacterium]|nr:monovalent cation/H(+) antiporter subunit G [Dehalococcoidia bacterium]
MSAAGTAMMAVGLFFIAVAALGLLRMPDFYTRVHAVSKSDTLGIALVLAGLALHDGATIVSLKLVLILMFIAMANPIGAHVLTRSALQSGLAPWKRTRADPEGQA